jgi:hypothetical protein
MRRAPPPLTHQTKEQPKRTRQSPELAGNAVHTGWLDSRIARRLPGVQAPWHLAVIAGAVVRAHQVREGWVRVCVCVGGGLSFEQKG